MRIQRNWWVGELVGQWDGLAEIRQSDEQTSERASLRRSHQLTSVCFAATDGRALRCSLIVQEQLAYEPGSRVLCRTLAFPRKEASFKRLRRIINSQIQLVISSGVPRRDDAILKNRYSFDESRNLSGK